MTLPTNQTNFFSMLRRVHCRKQNKIKALMTAKLKMSDDVEGQQRIGDTPITISHYRLFANGCG